MCSRPTSVFTLIIKNDTDISLETDVLTPAFNIHTQRLASRLIFFRARVFAN